MPKRSADQRFGRLDRLMVRAAVESQGTADMLVRHEEEARDRLGVALRLLADSSEEYRRAVGTLRAIDGTTRLSDARRLARRYLDSIA